LIVLDDASTDSKVVPLLEDYANKDSRLCVLKNNNNIGLTRSLNICLEVAKGDYIARQDSDDISLPKRFEEELKSFTGNVGLVSTWATAINSEGNKIPSDYIDRVSKTKGIDIKKENFIVGPAAMYTRKAFDTIGYYDESLYLTQDYNYWIRILKFFDCKIVEKDLYCHRKHHKSVRTLHKEFKNVDWNRKCQQSAIERPVIKDREEAT